MRHGLLAATLLVLLFSHSAGAVPFGQDDHPRHAAGKHNTYRSVPWAAVPEQRPSAPIPEPSGCLLFGFGALIVWLVVSPRLDR